MTYCEVEVTVTTVLKNNLGSKFDRYISICDKFVTSNIFIRINSFNPWT